MKAVRIYRLICILAILVLAGEGLGAQNMVKSSEFRGADRWAFKTNALAWVATVPNFTVEYDMSGRRDSHWTFVMSMLYNWEEYQTHSSYRDFNLLTVRPEWRRYWGARETNLSGDSRYGGTFFLGCYLSGGTYTMKLSEVGYQGLHTGVGVSVGYAMPLYQFDRGAVDVEFGLYLGAEAVTANAFVLNNVSDSYYGVPERSRGFGPVPYPVVSEISVTFSWRRTSIRHKYVTRYKISEE